MACQVINRRIVATNCNRSNFGRAPGDPFFVITIDIDNKHITLAATQANKSSEVHLGSVVGKDRRRFASDSMSKWSHVASIGVHQVDLCRTTSLRDKGDGLSIR